MSDELVEAVLKALESPRGKSAIKTAVNELFWQVQSDTNAMLHLMSTMRSAEFVRANIPLHLGFDMSELRRRAVMAAPADGLFMEFGVWKGHWITQMANMRPEVRFFGFDSFEGLPGDWSTQRAGHFDLGGVLPQVPRNVTLIKGWFNDTLPAFVKTNHEKVSFIHMDCDLYSSTLTVLDALRERLRPGTQIVLDDFMQQPGWENEEGRAFFDFTKRHSIKFQYTGWQVGSPGCSASIVLL